MPARVPEPIRKLIAALADLPSIGPRHATRLAFYLVGRGGNAARELARLVENLAAVKTCDRCFFVHVRDGAFCDICSDATRDRGTVLVVEKETDLISLESTGHYRGTYFIVGLIPKIGALADWQRLRLERLKSLITKEQGGQINELILGFNPTAVGDFNSSLIARELAGSARKLTRLGRGLPVGGEIEFADDETLASALLRRSS